MDDQISSTKKTLISLYSRFNTPTFIENDPISIPHQFQLKQDIEIAGLFAAVFSWGNRKTIINKCNELLMLMDHSPYQFVKDHREKDLKKFLSFKHRTFQTTDLLHFIRILQHHYKENESLESAFVNGMTRNDQTVEHGLNHFHDYFFSLEDSPMRTRKHIPAPKNNSSCKRLNMFLRWMVREEGSGIDFGIWKNIQPHQLVCPLDVHVLRVARELQLIEVEKSDWKTALLLTQSLKNIDPIDPVKFDIALFGWGVSGLPY